VPLSGVDAFGKLGLIDYVAWNGFESGSDCGEKSVASSPSLVGKIGAMDDEKWATGPAV
jgi:hypothetical protein